MRCGIAVTLALTASLLSASRIDAAPIELTFDLSVLPSSPTAVAFDLIDGDGTANSSVEVIHPGFAVLSLAGDAAVTPTAFTLSDSVFFSSVVLDLSTAPTSFSILLNSSLSPPLAGFPDSFAITFLDALFLPAFATPDPSGANASLVMTNSELDIFGPGVQETGVPEPATLALFGVVGLGILCRRAFRAATRLFVIAAVVCFPVVSAASDVTGFVSIQRAGLVLNRTTGTFNSVVTVKNTSTTVLMGPTDLLVLDLPVSVSVANATGLTAAGVPFIRLSSSGALFAPGQSLKTVLQLVNPKRLSVAPRLAVNAELSDPLGGITDVTLFGEPDVPLLLAFRLPDGSIASFQGTKDAEGVTTSVTSMRLQGAASSPFVTFFADAKPVGFRSPDGFQFKFSWVSDSQVLVSALSPDGVAQVNVSLAVPDIAPAATSLATLSKSVSTNALSVAAAASSNGIITANVTACGAPLSGASVSATVKPLGNPAGPGYGLDLSETAPGVYKAGFANFPSAIDSATLLSKCRSIAEPIAAVCRAGSKFSEALLKGGCLAIFQAMAAIPPLAPYAAGVLAACTASAAAVKAVCNPLQSAQTLNLMCSGVSSVVNFFDPDGARISVNLSGPKITSSQQSRDVPGMVGDVSFNFTLSGTPVAEAFTTSPVDPAPFQGYVASAKVSCLGAGNAIRVFMSGTDGFSTGITCATGAPSCSLSVPGAEAGVVDTISVSVGATVLRTIQLVF